MSKVQIFIDGKSVIADADKTILQVCREQGIHIPTLCHDEQLEPFTSCFLCVVEVEGARTFVPSCATKVSQGMKITTNSKAVWDARKMALELILSNHYADCLGPCKLTCPAGVDVQGYLALAAMGKYREAIELIKRNNPLPTICGRVCTRPCEMNCRRNLVDEPVAIDHVKRFIAEFDLESEDRYFPEVKPETGHKVAIIGAGPAGLSCAYYLRQEGHSVDIYDAKPKPGGMLRWGIPQYRLPEKILDKEIEGITRLGVNIYCNKALGRDFSLDDLFDEGYEAVFLGLGAQTSTSMRVENEDAEGVLSGIDFLEDVKLKKITSLKGKVAVIGGGNTAMDAARSALRLGADEVTIVYRRTINEMPANKIEIEEAQEEGVKFLFLAAPVKVILDGNGIARGLECVKMKLGEPDASGRRRPVPIEGSNFIMELDWIIAAIGQKPDLEFAARDNKLVKISKTRWGTLEIKPEVMETNIPGVFAGGDVVLGPATVIEAIADGRKAAIAIHKYLTGEKLEIPKKPFISRKENFKKLSKEDFSNVPKSKRQNMPVRNPEERKKDWEEIELGFTPEQVYQESIRCLSCGCQAFYECDLRKYATEYEANQNNYLGEFHDIQPDSSHPFIQIDLNKCILCGRCVRICDEVMGLGVLGFVQRGFKAKVKPVLEMPLAETHCISCGQCVETCPTGALIDKVDARQPSPWILDKRPTLCQYCSIGCSMMANVLDNRVLKISAKKDAVVNEFGNLCVRGRYGFRYVNSPDRLTQPLIRKNGKLVESTWEEAFACAAEKIQKSLAEGSPWAVIGSPTVTNEENFLLQKFARVVLKTNNLGSFSSAGLNSDELIFASKSTAGFIDIEKSDFIFVSNFDPMDTHTVLYIKLQKALRRGQAIYMACCPDSRLARKANLINIPEDKQSQFLQYIVDYVNHSGWQTKLSSSNNELNLNEIYEKAAGITKKLSLNDFGLNKKDFEAFVKKLVKAKKPLFIIRLSTASPEFISWMNALALILGKEDSILVLPEEVNYHGMLDMGVLPDFLPGLQKIKNNSVIDKFNRAWFTEIPVKTGIDNSQLIQNLTDGFIPNVIIWGQDPVGTAGVPLNRSENGIIIVADMFLTETAKLADVVFPLVPFTETSGTTTNAESRIQHFEAAIEPQTGYPNWKIIVELAHQLQQNWQYQNEKDIFNEIQTLVPAYRNEIANLRGKNQIVKTLSGHDKIGKFKYGSNYLFRWFDEKIGKTLTNISDLLKFHRISG